MFTWSVFSVTRRVPSSPPFVIGYQRGALVPIVPLRTSTPFGCGFLDDLNTLSPVRHNSVFCHHHYVHHRYFLANYRDHVHGPSRAWGAGQLNLHVHLSLRVDDRLNVDVLLLR